MLTDVAIRKAKPRERLSKLSDGGGLQLWITPTGGKLWYLAYRFGGRQKKLAIGAYGAAPARVMLEAARARRGPICDTLRPPAAAALAPDSKHRTIEANARTPKGSKIVGPHSQVLLRARLDTKKR